jgi:hypothetical protein
MLLTHERKGSLTVEKYKLKERGKVMAGNLEAILSTIGKLEYQNEFSIQKLLYFNCLAHTTVCNSRQASGDRGKDVGMASNSSVLTCFTRNRAGLTASLSLTEEERIEQFNQIKMALSDVVSYCIKKERSKSTRSRFSSRVIPRYPHSIRQDFPE